MRTFDVIVLGLGGMGSAAACHLAKRGRRVLGLDQFERAHDRGSSHGQTRVIRQCYFEHPAYVPLLLRAYELWRELEHATDKSLLLLTGGLMMGSPESEVVSGSLRSAQEHGLPYEMLDRKEIARRFPPFHLPAESVALWEPHAGLVRPEAAILAHLAQAERHGAELHFGERVHSWRSTSGGVAVVTTQGTYTAGHLVISPGPWAPELLTELNLPLHVERQVLLWFQPAEGVTAFQAERFPVYIWHEGPDRQPYGFPAVDGPQGGVKIAFFRKPQAEVCTPETVDRQVRPEDIEEMRQSIRRFLPSLDGRFLHGKTCLYTLTPDFDFVIGRHPQAESVTVACGFSGHGYKFCSVVGEILADLALHGTSRFDLGLFNPQRFRNPARCPTSPA